MRLSEIKPHNQQLLEAVNELARLVVDLNLDLLPDIPLSEEYERYLLDEGFLDMLKGLGKSAMNAWKAFTHKVATSSTPWAQLAKSIGIPKLIAFAKKSGKSVGDVLKDLAKASARGGHGGGHGGGGGGGGGGSRGAGTAIKDELQRYKDARDNILGVLSKLTVEAMNKTDLKTVRAFIDSLEELKNVAEDVITGMTGLVAAASGAAGTASPGTPGPGAPGAAGAPGPGAPGTGP